MARRLLLITFLLFVFTSTFSISLSQLSLGLAALCGLVVLIIERKKPFPARLNHLWTAIGVYAGWLIMVCLFQDNPGAALDHIREEWLFVAIPVGFMVLTERRHFDKVIMALACGLSLVSIASVLMYIFGVQYHWPTGFSPLPATNPRVHGNFTHALTFGNYAAVSSAFLIAWALSIRDEGLTRLRILALSAGGVGLVALLLCGSRGPVIAFVIGILVLLILAARKQRRWLLGILVGLLLIVILIPSVRSRFSTELGWHLNREWAGGRLFIWERSLEMAKDNPVLGIGPGNFSEAYQERLAPEVGSRYWYGHAHNDFLQAAVRSGVIGAISLMVLWIVLGRYLIRAYRRDDPDALLVAAMIGSLVFLVASMTEATFYDEEVRALLMLVWAVGLARSYKGSTGVTKESSA